MRDPCPPPFEASPLDGRIATGLHKLGLALKHHEWGLANAQGLSPTQGQIVSLLAAEDGLTASDVAARLGIGVPTISAAVTTLAAKRFVRRAPDTRHPRARRLHLTATGRHLSAETRSWPEFLARAVGALTPAEQATLLTSLMKMIRTLQEDGQIPLQRMCATCSHFRPHVRDGETPHHCAFVDAPMGAPHLRLDCLEHDAAPDEQQRLHWARFVTAV